MSLGAVVYGDSIGTVVGICLCGGSVNIRAEFAGPLVLPASAEVRLHGHDGVDLGRTRHHRPEPLEIDHGDTVAVTISLAVKLHPPE